MENIKNPFLNFHFLISDFSYCKHMYNLMMSFIAFLSGNVVLGHGYVFLW